MLSGKKDSLLIDMDYNENDLLWYWFVNIKGLGNVSRRELLARFGHPHELYYGRDKEVSGFLKAKQMKQFFASKNMTLLKSGMDRLKSEKTRFIHWESPDYPDRLRNIPDPPYGFYLRGRLPNPAAPALAMVGSRKATEYGMQIASYFAENLGRYGIQIISGLADGIDAAGHRGALQAGGYTLGVLGGGIDTVYPRDNFNLYMNMYEKGGVMSEWNLGVSSKPGMFPVRNRLISALSDGVFVVEAARRSGTFITVDQALEQGKTVFALPGRITDNNSAGTNQLIRDGAIPVLSFDDILEHLAFEGFTLFTRGENGSAGPKVKEENGSAGPKLKEENGATGPKLKDETDDTVFRIKDDIYDEGHQKVLGVLDEIEAKEFTELLRATGYNIPKLSHILYELELEGKICQVQNSLYLKNISIMNLSAKLIDSGL